MTHHRPLLLVFLLTCSLFFLAAKCVENDTLRRGPDGDWHIYGEIHNETDVQGVEIIVQATLFDGDGNVLATGQAPICPYELSPGQVSVYDIDFHNSASVPQPANYRINVMSGKALASALPQLDADLTDLSASRSGDTVTITGSVSANQNYPGDFSGCAAFYDSAGTVIQQFTVFGFGALPSGVSQDLELPLPQIPGDAQTVRFWLVGPGSSPLSSDYVAVMSGAIPID